MAKIYSYDAARTYSMELLPTDSTTLAIGDLVIIDNEKVVAAGETAPQYIVVGKIANGKVPVAAILDDMILTNSSAINGFTALGNNKYRK